MNGKNYSKQNLNKKCNKSSTKRNKKKKLKTQDFDRNSEEFKSQQENVLNSFIYLINNVAEAIEIAANHGYHKIANDFHATIKFSTRLCLILAQQRTQLYQILLIKQLKKNMKNLLMFTIGFQMNFNVYHD